MFEVNKDVDSMPPLSTQTEPDSNNEQRFPSQVSFRNQTNSISIPRKLDENFNYQKFSFEFQFCNQLIKAFSMFYLVFGFIVATSFFFHQIFNNINKPPNSWNWIGILNFVFIFINAILIISIKILIHRNPQFIKTKHPANIYLLYIITIVASAALSFFSLIFNLLKNIQCSTTVFADIFLPISRLFFIITAVIFISDLINYELECDKDCLALFFFYKLTLFLTSVTFVNTIIFEFLHSLSNSLIGNRTVCNETVDNFITINNTMQNYFSVFTLIFSIVSLIICVEPLKTFYWNYLPPSTENENQPLLPKNCHISQRRNRFIPNHFSIAIVIGVLIFLLTVFIVPTKILKKSSNITDKNIETIANSLPIFPYLICSFLDFWLLKSLYKKYHFDRENDFNLTFTYILWTSSFGILLMIFQNIILKLNRLPSIKGQYIIIIGLFCDFENLIETILQTMTIDYLLKMNWNCEIYREKLSRIFNCCVVLIAFNLGLVIVDYYNQAGNEIFKPKQDEYDIYMWYIITAIINPLTLIYRIFVPIVLWKFCSKLKCYELENESEY